MVELSIVHMGLYEAFLATLFYTTFCRATHMSKGSTKRDIRWSFTLLGIVAIVGMVAPLYGHDPDPLEICFLGAICIVQVVTAHHWRRGVPPPFRREP